MKFAEYQDLLPSEILETVQNIHAELSAMGFTEEIREADEFLKTRKGFGGSKESEQAQRAMYAVMIVSDQYAGTDQVNITVMTNTIDMLISKQQASRISFLVTLLQFAAKLIPESKKETGEETGQK